MLRVCPSKVPILQTIEFTVYTCCGLDFASRPFNFCVGLIWVICSLEILCGLSLDIVLVNLVDWVERVCSSLEPTIGMWLKHFWNFSFNSFITLGVRTKVKQINTPCKLLNTMNKYQIDRISVRVATNANTQVRPMRVHNLIYRSIWHILCCRFWVWLAIWLLTLTRWIFTTVIM